MQYLYFMLQTVKGHWSNIRSRTQGVLKLKFNGMKVFSKIKFGDTADFVFPPNII